jgi:NAD(P)-dependent dehydrogenase (short-subunit alcohol dehydrogenase family)
MSRHVFITGSSSGIGRACALHLAGLGWTVHAGVRKEADGASLVREGGQNIGPVSIDVAEESSIGAAAEEIGLRVGGDGLAALVNNAGVSVNGPVELIPMDGWRRQFEVNVFGQVAVTRAMLPHLRAHAAREGWARIVMMSSIAGRVGQAVLGPYCASKHALEAVSDALRYELTPQRIQVSIIEPGAIKSEIWKKGQEDAAASRGEDAAEARYRAMVDRVIWLAGKAEEGAIPAVRVAKVVERCLTARRPPIRVLVGNDAKALAWMKRVLPGSAVDWLFKRVCRIR